MMSALFIADPHFGHKMGECSLESIDIKYYEDDKFIGSASVYTEDKFLGNFEISPKYRNKGYGQKFLKYLIDKYDIQSLDVLDTNYAAQHIYEKFGFEFTGEKLLNMKRRIY